MTEDPPFNIVCFSSQEWDAPLRTNRQRIMMQAAAQGHRVLFVQTDGWFLTRLARLRRVPSTGAYRRVVPASDAPGVSIYQAANPLPRSWRSQTSLSWNLAAERVLLSKLLQGFRNCRKTVGWVYDPRASYLCENLGFDAVLYDCVDDYAQQVPESARGLVAEADAHATRKADVVITTTSGLYERKRLLNPRTNLVPNVADFGHFAAGRHRATPAPLHDVSRPVIGFVGNLIALKVDFAALRGVAAARPEWTLAVGGPVEAGARDELQRLAQLPNVRVLGPIAYDALPAYVANFDVGLVPYLENAYTAHVSPLKVFEYLAGGIPVVATGLPSVTPIEADVFVAAQGQTDGLVDVIQEALAHSSQADVDRRQALASEHTWVERANACLSLAQAALG